MKRVIDSRSEINWIVEQSDILSNWDIEDKVLVGPAKEDACTELIISPNDIDQYVKDLGLNISQELIDNRRNATGRVINLIGEGEDKVVAIVIAHFGNGQRPATAIYFPQEVKLKGSYYFYGKDEVQKVLGNL